MAREVAPCILLKLICFLMFLVSAKERCRYVLDVRVKAVMKCWQWVRVLMPCLGWVSLFIFILQEMIMDNGSCPDGMW